MKRVTIDPKMFIHEPYTQCPKCSKGDFGILNINATSYSKRCKSCWYKDSYKIPRPEKQVLLLDQFFLSQLAFIKNASLGKSDKVGQFYKAALEKLELLIEAQMLICPYAQSHEEESSMAHGYAPYLKELYKSFSSDTSFSFFSLIEQFQVQDYFPQWLSDKSTPYKHGLSKYNFLHGNGLSWHQWYYISVDRQWKEEYTESIRTSREVIYEGMTDVFQHWKREKHKQFKNWYEAEAIIVGPFFQKRYSETLVELNNGIVNYPFPPEYIAVIALKGQIKSTDDFIEQMKIISEYLHSSAFLQLPYISLQSALWATIAHEAAHTTKSDPPNKGMTMDITTVSRLFPYCDAMFVDKGLHQYLLFPQVKKITDQYPTQVFSLRNQSEFLAYLDNMILSIKDEHLKVIQELYGSRIVDKIQKYQMSLQT